MFGTHTGAGAAVKKEQQQQRILNILKNCIDDPLGPVLCKDNFKIGTHHVPGFGLIPNCRTILQIEDHHGMFFAILDVWGNWGIHGFLRWLPMSIDCVSSFNSDNCYSGTTSAFHRTLIDGCLVVQHGLGMRSAHCIWWALNSPIIWWLQPASLQWAQLRWCEGMYNLPLCELLNCWIP